MLVKFNKIANIYNKNNIKRHNNIFPIIWKITKFLGVIALCLKKEIIYTSKKYNNAVAKL